MSDARPKILVDPMPRPRWMIFDDEAWKRLGERAELVLHEGSRMPDAQVEEHLGDTVIVVGQTALPAERLARAPKLRAVINVKGNWEPSVDYAACEERRIPVLSIAPAMAPAVAEMALGLALDLARGITPADRAFRAGVEHYGILGNFASFPLRGADFGLIGFGNLGRELRPLLAPFGGRVLVHDPWLPEGLLRDHGCEPASLERVLSEPRVLFVLAGVTTENEGFLGRDELLRIREDAAVVLVSRAEVVDFAAFCELAQQGRFRAAVDVFPEEPVPADDPVRACDRILFSSHRAGGIPSSYARICEMLMDDIDLILRGLPPVRLQRAWARTAAVARSR
jgi:phosphoglycerate dehydrogenase-like enzyme